MTRPAAPRGGSSPGQVEGPDDGARIVEPHGLSIGGCGHAEPWRSLAWFGPLAASADATEAVATLVFLFLINATLEEVFYRIWLQTRLEHVFGRWPAIMAASLLWAMWHVVVKA
ncbi:MAG: lysostaphin resistance A-like protein, partial [Pseudonocardiaceae bacterium]